MLNFYTIHAFNSFSKHTVFEANIIEISKIFQLTNTVHSTPQRNITKKYLNKRFIAEVKREKNVLIFIPVTLWL